MNINKEARTECGCLPDEAELEQINALSRRPLTAEEVYTFEVRLCDNEVDRDFERFDVAALERLGQLFVGKTGLFDHNWAAAGQAARIYRTEILTDTSQTTSAGEPYTCLKGYAYMVRTGSNEDLIREIEGGIKKEVSVSCAVSDTRCSICGESLYDREACVHTKGRWYGDQLCYGILEQPTDAYEWSFVAVPAQPRAGVVKGFHRDGSTLKDFLAERPDLLRELEALEEEGRLGRKYLSALRREVVRLGGLLDATMDHGLRSSMAEKLTEEELLALKQGYEAQLEQRYPPVSQLYRKEKAAAPMESDGAFLI
ncbi:MAG: hypothetical protein LUD79_02865 [Oscillospiraceae bacterium]|nr:hypothetical protein [Oscillospiraceae bacterium]